MRKLLSGVVPGRAELDTQYLPGLSSQETADGHEHTPVNTWKVPYTSWQEASSYNLSAVYQDSSNSVGKSYADGHLLAVSSRAEKEKALVSLLPNPFTEDPYSYSKGPTSKYHHIGDYGFNVWVAGGDIKLGEGNGTPLQYSCLENPMDGGAWWAAVHGVAKSRTWLRDFTFAFHFHVMEKEMATHSSVLAWRIPGTAESHPNTPSQTHLETMFNQIIGYFMGQTDT